MKIERKLDEWREAGLIDADAVERIISHERGRSSPVVLYAVGGVGAVAIILGIVAIVASNWAEIPDGLKLAIDFVLGIGLAEAISRSAPGWTRETLLIVYYGFVLASMSLIGQIYHLESAPWRALTVWSVVTFPLMLMATGRFAATFWILGLASAHLSGLYDLIEWLDDLTSISTRTAMNLAVIALALSPVPYLLFSRLPWVRARRPAGADVFWIGGWGGIAVLVLLGASSFYVDIRTDADATPILGLWISLVLWSVLASGLSRLDADLARSALFGMRVLLIGGVSVSILAISMDRGDWPLVAALFQIFWLGWMAWTSLQAGHELGFRLFTALVCLRLVGVYIEVFGSMLTTGLGLIGGGLLTLALSWWWLRKSRHLAASLARGDASEGADA